VPISHLPAKSKTLYADARLARGDLGPELRRRIEDIRDTWLADLRPVVRRSGRDQLIGCGPTFGNLLEAQGKLDSFLDNKIRLVTTASIYRYLIDRAIESFSASEPVKARMPELARRKLEGATARRAALRQSVHEREHAAPPPRMVRPARGRRRKNPELVPAVD
jgi:hypothetical protein